MKVLKLLHPRDREELARRVAAALLHATPPAEAEESDIQQGASTREPFAPQVEASLRPPADDTRAEPTPPLKPGTNEETKAHQQSTSTVTEIWQKFKEASANQVSALERLVAALLDDGIRGSRTADVGR